MGEGRGGRRGGADKEEGKLCRRSEREAGTIKKREEEEKNKSSSECEEADGHQRAPLKESQTTSCSQEPYGGAAANSKSRAGINGSTATSLPPTKNERRETKRKE